MQRQKQELMMAGLDGLSRAQHQTARYLEGSMQHLTGILPAPVAIHTPPGMGEMQEEDWETAELAFPDAGGGELFTEAAGGEWSGVRHAVARLNWRCWSRIFRKSGWWMIMRWLCPGQCTRAFECWRARHGHDGGEPCRPWGGRASSSGPGAPRRGCRRRPVRAASLAGGPACSPEAPLLGWRRRD